MVYFLKYAYRSSKKVLLSVVFTGLICGASSVTLLAIIGRIFANSSNFDRIDVVKYFLLAIISLVCMLSSNFYVKKMLIELYSIRVRDIRKGLASAVLENPLCLTEQTGYSRLITIYTEDILQIGAALRAFASVAVNIFVIAGALVYLFWLSSTLFFVFVISTLFFLWLYSKHLAKSSELVRNSLQERDKHVLHYRNLISGVKELQLNEKRNEYFSTREFEPSVDAHQQAYLNSNLQLFYGEIWLQSSMFAFILLVSLFAVILGTAPAVIGSYLTVILFIRMYLNGIVGAVSSCNQAGNILYRNEALGYFEIDNLNRKEISKRNNSIDNNGRDCSVNLKISNLSYEYPDNGAKNAFTVKPINFTVDSPQLVFIVGDNGTGKTTFTKLLSGLYKPKEGTIHCNGIEITEDNLQEYRNKFSVLFVEPYVLDQLNWLPELQRNEKTINRYIKELGLQHKVSYAKGRLDTVNLSHGQVKRLGLLTAILEDRPIMVFDEWVENQDEKFRLYFYEKLVPEFKKSGKIVFIITHENKFLNLADQVIKLSV